MRYELTDDEWTAMRPKLPNKPRGVPRVNDRACYPAAGQV
jgi:transposase